MIMDWENIKFIFQIPLKWYRSIHDRVFKSYGTDFLRVDEGRYGGTRVSIEQDIFKDYVETIIDEYEFEGKVKTVNEIEPDENGNVDLGKLVKKVNDIEPDENGNIDLDANFLEASDITTPGIVVGTDYKGDQTVCSPNHKHNIKDVEGGIKTVNGHEPDEEGNVVVQAGVRTVNEIEPDEEGNVDLGPIVNTVNGHEPDEEGEC